MNVNRSARIMPGEDRLETYDSVVSTGLDAAQEGRVDVTLVIGVSVAALDYTGVDTLFPVKWGRG